MCFQPENWDETNQQIFFIDVPSGYRLRIGVSSSGFGSEQETRWGGACPGTNTVMCTDPWLNEVPIYNFWSNDQGTVQRAYFIIDAYSDNSESFNLTWSLYDPSATCNDTSEGANATRVWYYADDEWEEMVVGCDFYSSEPQACGGFLFLWGNSYYYDDTDFTATDMCCACGGGYVATDPPTSAPTPAPTPTPTPMPQASTTAEAAQTSGAARTSEPPLASTSVAGPQGAEDAVSTTVGGVRENVDDSGSLRAGHLLCPLAACLLVIFSIRQL